MKKKSNSAVPRIFNYPHSPLWTWAGFYVGGNFGYGTSRFNTDLLYGDGFGNALAATGFSVKHVGAMGGAQVGYNWQYGMWLAGLEADMTFEHYRTATVSQCPGAVCNPTVAGIDAPVSVMQQHNLDWFGTLRGRLGVAITSDLLAYATGGLAYSEIEHVGLIYGSDGLITNDAASTFASRALRGGWTAGGGIEARFAGNVTGKIEYLHMDFGFDKAQAILTSNATPTAVSFNSRIAEDLVRVGLNYKFDPYAAIYEPATLAPQARARPSTIYKAPLAAAWTWTGYYLGINAGSSWGKASTDALFNDSTIVGATFATNASYKLQGTVFGVQTGYNFALGSWLWGIEADAQLSGQHDTPIFACPGTVCNPAGPVLAAFDQNQRLQWFGTLRGRFGAVVTPDAVVFVTGGAAGAGLRTAGDLFGFDPTGAPATNPFSNITVNAGWTVGGGVEARLVGNWTGKIEYLYMDFGSITTGVNNQLNMTLTAAFNSRIADQIVRAGLNYRFD